MNRTYFFLSYAHSAPSAWPLEESHSPDAWVRRFYRDLCTAVTRRANTSLEAGFFDEDLQPGADWTSDLADALGAAEVFVPLYSPSYLNWSWPRRERAAFDRRLASAGRVGHPGSHVQPVLWLPVPAWGPAPDRDSAIDLGSGNAAYAENGLRALLMLTAYEKQYDAIVQRLALRIVTVAEGDPLDVSSAPSPSEVPDPVEASVDTPFVVALLTPEVVYSGRWRPFATQAAPIADYVTTVAERLGLPTRVEQFQAARRLFDASPGLVLIDPDVTQYGDNAGVVDVLRPLPGWVMLLVLADDSNPDRAARADRLFGDLRRRWPERVRRVRQADEFLQLMPRLIGDVRRDYLASGVYPHKGTLMARPTLSQRSQEEQ